MSIRYIIDLPCRVREQLGTEELESLLDRWQRALAVRDQFQADHGTSDEEEMQYRERSETSGEEPEMRNTTVAATRRACRPLEDVAPLCAGCPAALTGTPFSCVQHIALPIEAEAEAWLASRLAPPTGELGAHVAALMGSMTGEAAALVNWRRAGFLGAGKAMETAWGTDGDSSLLLALLLLRGGFAPEEIPILLLAMDMLETSDGRRGEEVLAVIEQIATQGDQPLGDLPSLNFAPGDDLPPHDSVQDFVRFFYAAYAALGLQVPFAVRA